ncbi:MAG: hypothetical protein EXR75_16755 [Myxococcales bacterium]|nr:hypothetical protein [Myxococcales bacterium]
MNRSAASLAFAGLAALFCGCDDGDQRRAGQAVPSAPGSAASAAIGAAQASATAARVTASGATPGNTANSALAAAPRARRTTSPAIALENFRAQLASAERLVKAMPGELRHLQSLVTAHLENASRLGVLESFANAETAASEAVKEHPKKSAAWLLRASVHSALHRFDKADADLAQAEKLGATTHELEQPRATLAMARGRYDEALAVFSARARDRGDTVSLALEAICLGHMQRTAESEAKFEAAVAAFHDTSPFVLAWLEFERGAMWERAGNEEHARRYYQAAVTRLPAFAHAVGHLVALVPAAEAKALLEGIVVTSDDPEYLATLSVFEEALAPGSGRVHRDAAAKGYDALMKRHPLAFADHAGWYYLSVAKEPERAVSTAALNLRNRRSSEAFELMILAENAADLATEACEHADEGLALRYVSSGLLEAASAAFGRCGKRVRADEVRAELAARSDGAK